MEVPKGKSPEDQHYNPCDFVTDIHICIRESFYDLLYHNGGPYFERTVIDRELWDHRFKS